ncbi:MAG: SMC family ATPase [Lachnospiraceae bacterium]|nr:SMC family ATPase [Lachnospiraceae bacterium]
MRPLKLIMSAFGPFADEMIIDFEKLGTSGLYLITGDTGAGKTTVFDAISYALYGAPSGEFRDGKMLRSKYAKPESICYVELTFENRGEQYVVKRIPEQMRAKLRGEGEAHQKAEAYLEYSDGRTPLSKIGDVDEEIRQIVGLNQKQFSQITMLAQGEFRKLLMASTDDKQKIFRDIFATEDYNRLQKKIKDIYLQMKKEYEKKKDHILLDVESLEYADDFSHANTLEEFCSNAQMVAKDELFACIRQLVDEDAILLEDYSKLLTEKDVVLQQLNAKIAVAKERDKTLEQLAQVNDSLRALEKQLVESEASCEKVADYDKKAQTHNMEAVRIEEKLAEYVKYDAVVKQLADKQKELSEVETQLKTQQETLEQKTLLLRNLQQVVDNNQDIDVKLLACEQNKKNLEEKETAILLLEKDYQEASALCARVEEKTADYHDIRKNYETIAKELLSEEKKFFDAQAGIMAKELQEEMPCPVCGSTQHPSPAAPVTDARTREELEELRSQVEEKRVQCDTSSLELTKLKEQWNLKNEQCKKDAAKLLDKEEVTLSLIKEEKENITARMKDVKQQQTLLEKQKKELVSAKDKLVHVEAEKKESEEAVIALDKKQVAVKVEINSLEEDAKQKKANLQFHDLQAAEDAIAHLRKQASTLLKEKQDAEKMLLDVKQKLSETTGKKESLLELLKEQLGDNVQQLEQERDAILLEKKQTEQDKNNIYARHQKNDSLRNRIEKQWNAFVDYEKEYMEMKRLSDTLNGELTGKEKIKFETYILMAYFERVLQKANVRFLGMTGGQYELVRSVRVDNQRSQSGLDLDVYDHYTASVRSVKSLSGGETFMASLSLALGLADEIQAAAGGIRMDTLFVDEGFGSLDEDTLRRAMNELNRLTEGNRLVGVISHVSELKQLIDKQILVTKEVHAGSKVRLVF